jgi:uncharacterized damage-inducible protein DinB
MLSSDPLAILAGHDAWATRRLLEMCAKLPREQFHQKFEIGLGSLHDNLTHIVGAMRRWADRIDERPLREPIMRLPYAGAPAAPQARDRTAQELLEVLDEAEADLRNVIEAARAGGLGETVQVVWPATGGGKKTYTFSKGAALTHLFTHGEWHRAQCVNMLRHLKVPGLVEELGEISVVEWQAATESPPVAG